MKSRRNEVFVVFAAFRNPVTIKSVASLKASNSNIHLLSAMYSSRSPNNDMQ